MGHYLVPPLIKYLKELINSIEPIEPGSKFRDCKKCPELVVVPKGSYTMGGREEEPGWDSDESPRRTVEIEKPFAVGVNEVTFGEWDACVSGGGCGGYRPDDKGWGNGTHPVIHVSWSDAQAYVEWLRKETGEAYRLLSESEWEYVARAGTGTLYFWGDDIGSNQANCQGCESEWDGKSTAPVKSFEANGFGVYDMHGNVYEWVQDCWYDSYQGAPADGRARKSGDCKRRVVRGGSWNGTVGGIRSANRDKETTENQKGRERGEYLGFRVARTLTP